MVSTECHEVVLPVPEGCLDSDRASSILFGPHGTALEDLQEKIVQAGLHIEGDGLSGFYTEYGMHHQSPAFVQDNARHPKYCFYWDDRDGANMSGWWIADDIGADMFLAFNGDTHAPHPAYCRLDLWEGDKEVTAVRDIPRDDSAIVEFVDGAIRIEVSQEIGLRRAQELVESHLSKVAEVMRIDSVRRPLCENTMRGNVHDEGISPSRKKVPREIEEDYTLRITNLPVITRNTEQNLRALIEGCGLPTVKAFAICEDTALLSFYNVNADVMALRRLHDKFFLGNKLHITYIEKDPDETPLEVHDVFRDPCRIRTTICAYAERKRNCPRGAMCMYAHSEAHLRTGDQEDRQWFRVLVFNLPDMVTQSSTTIIEFLKHLGLDYGLEDFQVDIAPTAVRLRYDSVANALRALKDIGRIRALCGLPYMGLHWIDPDGFDPHYNGPPLEVHDYYADKTNPEVEEAQLDCWMFKFKKCPRYRCAFLHPPNDEATQDVELENPNQVVKVKNWWGAREGVLGPMLSVTKLLRPQALSEHLIRGLFSPFGVEDVYLVKDADGKNSGEAFVEFEDLERCANALRLMNCYIWRNEPIYCEWRCPPNASLAMYPEPILGVYLTPARRKTRFCPYTEVRRNCPNYHRCPFAHEQAELRVVDAKVVVDVSRVPVNMPQEAVEKALFKNAGVDLFEWCRDDETASSGRAIFNTLDLALSSLDFLAGMAVGEGNESCLRAAFSMETRAPEKVVEFYKQDRFTRTRLCDFPETFCPGKADCPFAHTMDEIFPCTPREESATPWRSAKSGPSTIPLYPAISSSAPSPSSAVTSQTTLGGDTKAAPWTPPVTPAVPQMPLPLFPGGAPLLPPGAPSLRQGRVPVVEFSPLHPPGIPGGVSPHLRPTSRGCSPRLPPATPSSSLGQSPGRVTAEAEGDAIDFSKAKKNDKSVDWSKPKSQTEAPLEWEISDEEELKKRKAKLKGKKEILSVFGFPLEWDVSTARKVLESLGDVFNVSLLEPGYLQVEISKKDKESWVNGISSLKVEGKSVQLLEQPKRKRKAVEPPAESPAKKREYEDFI